MPDAGAPSIQVTGVEVVDINDNPITVTAGVPFWDQAWPAAPPAPASKAALSTQDPAECRVI